jgi:hypothetical protein
MQVTCLRCCCQVLAQLAQGSMRGKISVLTEALTGYFRDRPFSPIRWGGSLPGGPRCRLCSGHSSHCLSGGCLSCLVIIDMASSLGVAGQAMGVRWWLRG